MKFLEKLKLSSSKNRSFLCVGLDPDPQQMPDTDILSFCKEIVDSTRDLVCAYKPNFAFFEAQGLPGIEALYEIVDYIPDEIPVIADAKRGDIGNTAKAYARAVFEQIGCDAITVNPYLGYDALQPFLDYGEKGVFILCRTSNKGAKDFQDIVGQDGIPLYLLVAKKAVEWNKNGNVGLVVGATFPDELKRVREICPDMPLLIPGVGTQGGDMELALKYGLSINADGAIINVSRQIIYASRDRSFARAARAKAKEIRDGINMFVRGMS